MLSHSVMSDPMVCSPPGSSVHGDSPGKNTGVGCHVLLQGIFPTQGLNPDLLHCRWILYHLSHQGSPDSHLFMPSQTKSEFAIALWSCGFASFLASFPPSFLPFSLLTGLPSHEDTQTVKWTYQPQPYLLVAFPLSPCLAAENPACLSDKTQLPGCCLAETFTKEDLILRVVFTMPPPSFSYRRVLCVSRGGEQSEICCRFRPLDVRMVPDPSGR